MSAAPAPDLLLQEGRFEELYILGRAPFQMEDGEPSRRAGILTAALKAALGRDNPAEVAEFAIRLARLPKDSKTELPLHALRTAGLERALQLAEATEPPRRVLWLLLLLWELREANR